MSQEFEAALLAQALEFTRALGKLADGQHEIAKEMAVMNQKLTPIIKQNEDQEGRIRALEKNTLTKKAAWAAVGLLVTIAMPIINSITGRIWPQ